MINMNNNIKTRLENTQNIIRQNYSVFFKQVNTNKANPMIS